jgi:hypothetical protein
MKTRLLITLGILALSIPLAAFDVNAARFSGKPKFDEGNALGYFIWVDGDTWKLRWTTFGAAHKFTGRVTLDNGQFTKFKRIDVDTERKLIAPGRPGRVVRGPRGRVVGVAGGKPAVVGTKTEDVIMQETERLIRFDTETNDDLDGLEFEISRDATLIRFMLQIEGKPVPQEVEIGKDNFKPNQMPLVVRIR